MSLATLDSICTRISSGGTPSRKHPEYYAENGAGHLWVKSKELLDGVIQDTEEKISDLGLKKSSAKYYPENTVLVAMYGANVGQLGWLRVPATVNQAICGLVVDDEKADWRFVFYSLLKNRDDLTVQAQGAAQQNLNQDLIRQFSIPLLSLEQQRKASKILSAYDDLIENCQRRIRILEKMARELYREWFVEFRFPGHESVRRVASRLGEIPEGWEVKRLGEVLELNYGKSLKKEERQDGDIPVYGSSGVVGTHAKSLTKGPGIVVGRKGNVGSVFWCETEFFVIDTAYYVTSVLPLRYLYYVLPTLNFINSDAAVPGLSRNQAYALNILVPSKGILEKFCDTANAYEGQAIVLQRQIDNLRQTRDLLLPRLLSGEVNLSVAEPLTSNVIPFPAKAQEKPKKEAPDEFKEAVLIAELVRRFSKPEYPLGRMRYNKFSYLAHRKVEDDVQRHYLKQAAGPYSPWAKYEGPERIAQKNGYIKFVKTDKAQGFLPGPKIGDIDRYLSNYPACLEVAWVDGTFRYKKKEELELITTVDFAVMDLLHANKPVTTKNVKQVIAENPKWAPKLDRSVFSDANIAKALDELGDWFPALYSGQVAN